jgi:hypothetical protein
MGPFRATRMMMKMMNWFLPGWLALLLDPLSLLGVAQSQRIKKGCYETRPIQCSAEVEFLTRQVDLIGAEKTCFRLATEIFKAKHIYYDTSRHAEFLNSIESTDPFCSEIRKHYPMCTFCKPDEDEEGEGTQNFSGIKELCYDATWRFECRAPSQIGREMFSVPDDSLHRDYYINATCEALSFIISPVFFGDDEAYENLPIYGMKPAPLSTELCFTMYTLKHLCPNWCDDGCFTEENPPPTCDVNASNYDTIPFSSIAKNNTRIDSFSDICNAISLAASWSSKDWHNDVLNVSSHLQNLRAISKATCARSRAAYPHCAWCDPSNLCFSEQEPATCDQPIGQGYNLPNELAQEGENMGICNLVVDMASGIAKEEFFGENVSVHTGHIALSRESQECWLARQHYHECLWCRQNDIPRELAQACIGDEDYCLNNVEIPESQWNQLINDPAITKVAYNLLTMDANGLEQYCNQIGNDANARNTAFIYTANFHFWGCVQKILLAKKCPRQFCHDPNPKKVGAYLGASTTGQKRALIWASRVAAMLSFGGATYILYNSLSDEGARHSVYHQLLVGMATFDLVTASSWAFATAPINSNDIDGSKVLGASGTDGTCKAQGCKWYCLICLPSLDMNGKLAPTLCRRACQYRLVFIQLGFTSVFYAMSLAFYYYLVIARGWKEFQLRKVLLALHGLPLLVGFTLAFAAIPQYGLMVYVCHLEPPSAFGNGQFWPILVFVVIPLSIAIVSITACMTLVYCKVRQQSATSKKWTLGIGSASKMEQVVFWQAFFYVFAFYVTWPPMFAVYLASIDEKGPFGLTCLIAVLAPLQGFLNFLGEIYAESPSLHCTVAQLDWIVT